MRYPRIAPGVALLVLGVAGLAAQTPPSALRKPTLYEDLQMFSQVLNQIRVNHVDSVDGHRLIMAAVEGMVHAADPHSFVLPVTRLSPEKAQALEDGKLVPVPVSFRFVGGTPVVSSVAPTSKAARTDILAGDELVAIDGQPVLATTAEELEIVLSGSKNAPARLTLARERSDGSAIQVDRVVIRENAAEATAVPVALMIDPTTGYVRITSFNNLKVADDFHDAIGRLKGRGMRRLVLDLRDNGGGIVSEATRVVGEFLPAGAIVYTSEERRAAKPDTVKVKRSFWKDGEGYPVVVLVNDGTASASELVAGALQDHDRALIVGRASFGKSLLMRGFPLLDGSVIMMAFGRVLTPCGRVLQREYRGVSRRDYYRLAGVARDTAGRPSCLTNGGRRLYGGGGIYPDLVTPEPAAPPVWLSRLLEDELPLQWVGGYLSTAVLPSLDSLAARPALPAGAIQSFRQFAEAKGQVIPAGPEIDGRLERSLLRYLAFAKWGDAGFTQIATALDPVVKDAGRYFDRARELKLQ